MYVYIKRFLDLAVSLILLLGLSPFILAIALIITVESQGGVLFRQTRSGKNKVPFVCYKFRTMSVDAPKNKATRDLKNPTKYITKSGKILRRLGLDELPQLINVIKGDMSLIGPRPVILAEKDLISERDKYGANAMMPGIGGWAQSNGRDELDYKTKARLDGEYTQNFGLRMDFSCLWRTIVAVFTSKGFKEGGVWDGAYKKRIERNSKRVRLQRSGSSMKNRPGKNKKIGGLGIVHGQDAK